MPMDQPDSKSPELERSRLSVGNSARVSMQGREGEGLDFIGGTIADGFRPSQQPDAPEPPAPSHQASTRAAQHAAPPSSPARPSSITKHPRQNDSFSLRHDGAMGTIRAPAPRRSPSMATDTDPYITAHTPYQGPSNPSHPYQMYPQNVRLARTSSVATTSTAAVSDSSYVGPSRPTHPYSMYPQGTGETDVTPAASAPVIHVGFPGILDQYQRRLGPDGEEIGDMIGPDGHTEQLPPYTRYPDEAYAAKLELGDALGRSAATAATASRDAAPLPQPIPGAGGIGLATRNPEFEPADDLDIPRSRQSCRSFASDHSNQGINVAAAGESEKPMRSRHWSKRRFMGVMPYWALFLAGVGLLVLGAILGSVIGTVLVRHENDGHPNNGNGNGNGNGNSNSGSGSNGDSSQGGTSSYAAPTPDVTFTYDATPIPTPSNLANITTGTYSLPLNLSSSSDACFESADESSAWSCDVIQYAGLSVIINEQQTSSSGGNYFTVELQCNESATASKNVYTYGEQPPVISATLPLELVNDTMEPSFGPAWFGMIEYTKTVILDDNALSVASTVSSRQISSYLEVHHFIDDFQRKSVAQSGDSFWLCSWPQTYLEIFIYVEKNIFSKGSSSTQPSTTTPTSTQQYTGSYYHSPSDDGYGASMTEDHVSRTTSYPAMSTGTGTYDLDQQSSTYPNLIKLEERREPGSQEATCTLMKVVTEGQPAQAVTDSDGNAITIDIAETAPSTTENADLFFGNWRNKYNQLKPRDSTVTLTQCGCLWFTG